MPDFPSVVDIVHVTLRVADVEFAGTDDTLIACFSEEDCFDLSKPDWNDNERGQTEVHVVEGFDMPRARVDRFTVAIDDGSDRFEPVCAALSLDGEPISCQPMTEYLGTDDDDELPLWSGELSLACRGCFDTMVSHGPFIGPSGALWFRTDATRRVVVSVGDSVDSLAPHTIVYPLAVDDFTVQVELASEGPGEHWVGLEVDGVSMEPVLLEVPERLTRLAFGSCIKSDEQPVWSGIVAWEPDLFLFIGDNHYANSDDLGTLRSWYRWGVERRGLLQGTSQLATWDDHDYVGNNTDGSEPGRDVALRTFVEYWANPSYGADDLAGVFTRQRVGDVEVFLIDDRYWRGFDDSMLGDAQQAWLIEAVQGSDAPWKLLGSGSQWTSQGSGDSWAAFDDAREALFAELTQVPGVVLLSGDIHRSELRLLPAPGYDLPELTSSPLANLPSLCKSSEEQIACYDDGVSWIGVEIAADQLTATIYDEAGEAQASWDIDRADLQP